MGKIFKLLKKNILIFAIVIFLIIFYLPILINTCPLFTTHGFDAQALFTWYYTSINGLLPYRDVFYPYGILPYYKDVSFVARFVYVAINPVVFLLLFLLFQKIWKSNFLSIASFIFFFIFTLYFNGDTFINYGLVTTVGTCFAFLFAKKHQNKTLIFFIGLFCGALFSVFHPPGYYLIALFIAGLAASCYLRLGLKLQTLISFIKSTIIFSLGVFLGFIPFFLFLLQKGIFYDYINFYTHLSNIVELAKTPFIPYSTTPPNLFTFAIFILTAFYITYIFYFKKSGAKLADYFLIQLFFVLILFENISVIRSVDSLITFVPLFIIIIFASMVYDKKKPPKNIFTFFYLVIFVVVFFGIGLSGTINYFTYVYSPNPATCLLKNKNEILLKNKNIASVVAKIKAAGFNKVFSFPGDPVFYVLLNQRPPYYFSNYESSMLNWQKIQNEYLEKNNIQVVVYNTLLQKLQDEVPNYIRTPHQFSYILNNYTPVFSQSGYYVLERNDKNKIPPEITVQSDFYHPLLKVDFEKIPFSEGMYKNKLLQDASILITTERQEELNIFLKQKKIDSQNTLLLVKTPNQYSKEINLSIQNGTGVVTDVKFKSCMTFYCLINLARIPLFYRNQEISNITINQPSEIKIIKVRDISPFW